MRGTYERAYQSTFQPNQPVRPANGEQLTLPEMPWQGGDLAPGAVETSLLPRDRALVSLRLRSEGKQRRENEPELIDQIERQESYSVSWAWRNPRIAPVQELMMGLSPFWDNKRKKWLLPDR